MERGARLKELNRRAGKENTADVLLLEGDLFLDPREDKEILCATAQKACVEVHRSVLCQLLHDHQADYLAPLYFPARDPGHLRCLCPRYARHCGKPDDGRQGRLPPDAGNGLIADRQLPFF